MQNDIEGRSAVWQALARFGGNVAWADAAKTGDGQHRDLDLEGYVAPDQITAIRAQEFAGDISKADFDKKVKVDFKLKAREEHLKELQDPKAEYDMLIVGGGASGAGVAIDAASRGLRCAVVDKFDFASGTSSRSTKMAHGGIRYFEQMMFLQGDPVQSYGLLNEALDERNFFLQAAPYLNRELRLLIPSNSLLSCAFFYFPGAFLYHLLYMKSLLGSSYKTSVSGPKILRKRQVTSEYPEAKQIHGMYGVQMHEAQMMDSRMGLNCLLTASIDKFAPGMRGATLANYVEFKDFLKGADGKICGAVLFDCLTQKEFKVKSKIVVNCAGIQADELRLKDDEKVEKRIQGARGTHLMFKKGIIPQDSGILIPKTKDGRLLFVINYLGHPMVGTTDVKCDVTHYCQPTQQEIDFICEELRPYFGEDYDYKGNLVSAWAGIRPLVKERAKSEKEIDEEQQAKAAGPLVGKVKSFMAESVRWFAFKVHSGGKPKSSSTARLSRSHVIEVSDSGLVSLMGGKWTSFRRMGQDTVETILEKNPELFEPKHESAQTKNFNFIGSYSRLEAINGLVASDKVLYSQYEDHLVFTRDLPRDVAKHLVHTYGTTSTKVVDVGDENRLRGLAG